MFVCVCFCTPLCSTLLYWCNIAHVCGYAFLMCVYSVGWCWAYHSKLNCAVQWCMYILPPPKHCYLSYANNIFYVVNIYLNIQGRLVDLCWNVLQYRYGTSINQFELYQYGDKRQACSAYNRTHVNCAHTHACAPQRWKRICTIYIKVYSHFDSKHNRNIYISACVWLSQLRRTMRSLPFCADAVSSIGFSVNRALAIAGFGECADKFAHCCSVITLNSRRGV